MSSSTNTSAITTRVARLPRVGRAVVIHTATLARSARTRTCDGVGVTCDPRTKACHLVQPSEGLVYDVYRQYYRWYGNLPGSWAIPVGHTTAEYPALSVR